MLMRHHAEDTEVAPVVNYTEQLVFEYINRHLLQDYTLELLQDIACIALNSLPPRYIRHQVDLTFYLPSGEQQAIYEQVELAVKAAAGYVAEKDAAE